MVKEEKTYRRTKDSVIWHFNKNCNQYPQNNFIANKLSLSSHLHVVCPNCKFFEKKSWNAKSGFFSKKKFNYKYNQFHYHTLWILI